MHRHPLAARAASVLVAGLAVGCSLVTDLGGLSGGGEGGSGSISGDAAVGDALPPGSLTSVGDATQAEFAAGTFEGTQAVDGRVVLKAGAVEGRFVSRVLDAARDASFATLAWTPLAPYGKPLPDRGGKERGYERDGLDMRDNVLLFHFDGDTGPLSGVVSDVSGADNHGLVRTRASTASDGVILSALRDELDGYVAVPIAAGSGLNLAASDVTWMFWVRTTQDCPVASPPSGNRVFLGAEEGGDSTHLWFGCRATYGSDCPGVGGTGHAGGTWCSRRDPTADCASFCGGTTINDGAWHHLAVVKRGHAPGTLRLFVDGERDAVDVATAFETPIAFAPDTELALGALSRGTFAATGDFDEVAIFRRALSDDEVRAVFRRGALDLSLRVRVCARADCSDGPPFVGPRVGVSFRDEPPSVEPPSAPLTALPRGRWVQYEATLRSRAAGESPALDAVTVLLGP